MTRDEAVLNEVRAQRNHALDMLANALGRIAELEAEVKRLEESRTLQKVK